MNENKKGYWIYSVIAIIVGVGLFAFWAYLIYDLILKLAKQDLSNNTMIQSLITLVTTVFLGGYFSKWLERRNAKKLEVFKIQKDIALKVIDYVTILYYHPDDTSVKELLAAESIKVKLYFDDETLKILNEFIKSTESVSFDVIKTQLYDNVSNQLKKVVK